jgi:hypothetical protein
MSRESACLAAPPLSTFNEIQIYAIPNTLKIRIMTTTASKT